MTKSPNGSYYCWSLSHKIFVLSVFHDSHKLDAMFLTETWLREDELVPPARTVSPGPWGGEVGWPLLLRILLTEKQILKCCAFSSFELQLLTVNRPSAV